MNDPFIVFGFLILIVAKCMELLAAVRLFLIHVISTKFQIFLGYDSKILKNLDILKEEMRRTMVVWKHSESNTIDQLRMSVLHIQSNSTKETESEDMTHVITNLEAWQHVTRQQSSSFFEIFQRITAVTIWSKLLRLMFGFFCAVGICYFICYLLELRMINSFGIYQIPGFRVFGREIPTLKLSTEPHHDMLFTAILVAIATYFWHTAVFFLAKVKEKAVAKRDIIA